MTSWTPGRRAADHFDRLLSGDAAERGDRPELAELAQLVTALRTLPDPTPDPAFAADLRERLMTEADTALATVSRPRPLPTDARPAPQRRRLAAVVAAVAVVGATGTVSVAAQGALPGDPLYTVKRAMENAQLSIGTANSRTELLLSQAGARLDEATALAAEGSPETTDQIAPTMTALTEQATKAANAAVDVDDAAQISRVRTFIGGAVTRLALLAGDAPVSAAESIESAARQLTELDAQMANLCTDCGGPVVELPQIFLTNAESSADPAQPGTTPTDSVKANNPDGHPVPVPDPSSINPGLPNISPPGSPEADNTGADKPGADNTGPDDTGADDATDNSSGSESGSPTGSPGSDTTGVPSQLPDAINPSPSSEDPLGDTLGGLLGGGGPRGTESSSPSGSASPVDGVTDPATDSATDSVTEPVDDLLDGLGLPKVPRSAPNP